MADSILRQSYNRRDVEHWRFHYDEYFHYGDDGRARKTTFLVSTETLSVWQNAMKWMEISAKMDMIGPNLRKLAHRLSQKRTKKVPERQKQQWRTDERRRSRQPRPGRL